MRITDSASLVLLCAFLAGCGGSSASSSSPYPGSYSGTTAQGDPIELTVATDRSSLSTLSVQARYACPLKATAADSGARTPGGPVPLKHGSFSGLFTAQGTTYRVAGTYRAGAFTGTLAASFPADAGSGTCASGTVSWRATRAAATAGAPSAVRRQLETAAATYDAGAATFNSRANADVGAGNFSAFKTDVASFRTALFNFDAAVRRITFLPADQHLANALLAADRTELADLDAIGSAGSEAQAINLYNRALADNQAVIAAERALYGSP